MTKSPRLENKSLLAAGLEQMLSNGKPLTKMPSFGRAMIYSLPNGETVRVRTCNDHILIVVADEPTLDAKLNIEGTDWLLVIMPEVERTAGKVFTYLIPTSEAVRAARETHQAWLASNPGTKGANTTRNLWFKKDGPEKANDFAAKWAKYRLKGEMIANERTIEPAVAPTDIKAVVEGARQQIAKAASVSPDAVKITIDFSL